MAKPTLNDNAFVQGTPTTRVRTSDIEVGQALVATRTAHPTGTSGLLVLACSIPAMGVVRTVDRVEIRHMPTRLPGGEGRSIRVYNIYFTDGTFAENVSPLVMWYALKEAS